MTMETLNKRQLAILEFINRQKSASNRDIKKYLEQKDGSLSRVTIVRDIDELLKKKVIVKKGSGRSVQYESMNDGDFSQYINVTEYFKKSIDERKVLYEHFNFEIFDELSNTFFSKEELKKLNEFNDKYQKRIKTLSPTIIKKEFERLTTELAWKSSQIEGNTYSLLDTEVLIKEHKEAKGHNKQEAIMILNHKYALDFILDKKSDFKKMSLKKIENIHQLVTDKLGVSKGLRKKPVGITGTKYKPIDNEFQIKEVIEKAVDAINNMEDVFSKALLAVLMISYIQPFEDGNKRTARLLGNAILLAYSSIPLSYRSVDEGDYKKAVILFYEQNNARFFKELFIEQYVFAVDNYFLG